MQNRLTTFPHSNISLVTIFTLKFNYNSFYNQNLRHFCKLDPLRACETLWNAREALSAERANENEDDTENEFHSVLMTNYNFWGLSRDRERWHEWTAHNKENKNRRGIAN